MKNHIASQYSEAATTAVHAQHSFLLEAILNTAHLRKHSLGRCHQTCEGVCTQHYAMLLSMVAQAKGAQHHQPHALLQSCWFSR